MNKKEKKYIAPMDLFGGIVKKGDIYKTRVPHENSVTIFAEGKPLSSGLPAEIVETWEEYIEDPFKELKEAYDKGSTIQVDSLNGWKSIKHPLWNKDCIYRIKPEPKYIPFTWEDREELRGKWIKSKSNNNEYMIFFLNNLYVGVQLYAYTYTDVFEKFTFLDGTPCGKLVKE